MTISKLPFWARKPLHKGVVVATEKGWELESTGELLVRVQGLSTRLTEFYKTAPVGEVKDKTVVPEEPVVTPDQVIEQNSVKVVEDEPVEKIVITNPEPEEVAVPKKRGRPAKVKS